MVRRFSAESRCLTLHTSSGGARRIAIVLLDRQRNALLTHFTKDWTGLNASDLEHIANVGAELVEAATQWGGIVALQRLDAKATYPIELTRDEGVSSADLTLELARLCAKYGVDSFCANGRTPSERSLLVLWPSVCRTACSVSASAVMWIQSLTVARAASAVAAATALLATYFGMITALTTRQSDPLAMPSFSATSVTKPSSASVDQAFSTAEPTRQTKQLLTHHPRIHTPPRRRAQRAFIQPPEVEPRSTAVFIEPPSMTVAPIGTPGQGHFRPVASSTGLPPPPHKRSPKMRKFLRLLALPFRQTVLALSD